MSYVHTNGFASIMGKWFVTVPDAQPSLLAALDVRLLVLVCSLTCGSSYLHSFFWHLGTFSVISGSTGSRRLKVIVEPIIQDIQVVIHSQWHLTQLQCSKWPSWKLMAEVTARILKKVTGWWPNHFKKWSFHDSGTFSTTRKVDIPHLVTLFFWDIQYNFSDPISTVVTWMNTKIYSSQPYGLYWRS